MVSLRHQNPLDEARLLIYQLRSDNVTHQPPLPYGISDPNGNLFLPSSIGSWPLLPAGLCWRNCGSHWASISQSHSLPRPVFRRPYSQHIERCCCGCWNSWSISQHSHTQRWSPRLAILLYFRHPQKLNTWESMKLSGAYGWLCIEAINDFGISGK